MVNDKFISRKHKEMIDSALGRMTKSFLNGFIFIGVRCKEIGKNSNAFHV